MYTGRDGSIGFSVLAASNVELSSDWTGCCRTGSRVESERVGRECESNTGSSMSNDCGLAIDIDGVVSSAGETTSIRLRPQKTKKL